MATTVRHAQSTEAELLHELARDTFPLACPVSTTPEAIASFIAEHLSVASFTGYLADASCTLLIGDVDGQPAGYVLLRAQEPSDPDVAQALTVRPSLELSKCYVLSSFHGAGVASALIEASRDWARENGFAALWLGVNNENVRANRFYEKMGFAIVGTKKFLVGERWEDDFVREAVIAAEVPSS